MNGIETPATLRDVNHARHLYTIWVESRRRDATLLALQKKGIGAAVNYRAVHLLDFYKKAFGYEKGSFPIAERIGDRTITLPLHPSLPDEKVERVIKTVREVVTELI
nr:hypothetical protein [Desulfobacterales bacterium]